MKINEETFPLKVQLRVKEEENARLRDKIKTMSSGETTTNNFRLSTLRFLLEGGLDKQQIKLFKEVFSEYLT